MRGLLAALLCVAAAHAVAQGYPAKPVQYDTNAWYSVHAPAGTPPEVVRRLNAELVAILKEPDVQARFKQLSTDPVGNTPEEFAAFVKAELDKYARVIKSAGIRLD